MKRKKKIPLKEGEGKGNKHKNLIQNLAKLIGRWISSLKRRKEISFQIQKSPLKTIKKEQKKKTKNTSPIRKFILNV